MDDGAFDAVIVGSAGEPIAPAQVISIERGVSALVWVHPDAVDAVSDVLGGTCGGAVRVTRVHSLCRLEITGETALASLSAVADTLGFSETKSRVHRCGTRGDPREAAWFAKKRGAFTSTPPVDGSGQTPMEYAVRPATAQELGARRRAARRISGDFYKEGAPMPIPFPPSPGVPSSSSVALAGPSRRPTIMGSRSSPRAAGRNRCCWRWCTSAREPRGDSSGAGSRRRRGVRGFRRTFRTPTRVGVGRAASRTRTERARVSCREGNWRRGRASTWRTSSCAGARARGKLRKSRKSRVTRRSRLEVSGDPSAPGSLRARTRWYDAWCGARGADGPSRVRRCWIPRRSRSPRGDREAARDATGAWGFTNCHTTSGSVP